MLRGRGRFYAAVDDVGRAINPLIVLGRTHGGIVQGVGQAMVEACIVVSAIADALTPLGVTEVPMPATPYAIWRAIRAARRIGTPEACWPAALAPVIRVPS